MKCGVVWGLGFGAERSNQLGSAPEKGAFVFGYLDQYHMYAIIGMGSMPKRAMFKIPPPRKQYSIKSDSGKPWALN